LQDLERRGSHAAASARDDAQPDLFAAPVHPAVAEIAGLDIANLTPIEALNILDRLKKGIEGSADQPASG
jgi:hypothetical protein